jgi:hypothetical protein
LITNELVGEVNKEFVTLDTVNVKLVPAFTTCKRLILIVLEEETLETDDMEGLIKEHVEVIMLSWVYDGKMMLIKEPTISLFTVTNQMSYDVTLPMIVTWALALAWVIIEGEAMICRVVSSTKYNVELIICSDLKVIVTGFWANGGVTIVKFPIERRVGSEVVVFLVKLPMSIWLVGCPLISKGILDKLLNA